MKKFHMIGPDNVLAMLNSSYKSGKFSQAQAKTIYLLGDLE